MKKKILFCAALAVALGVGMCFGDYGICFSSQSPMTCAGQRVVF